MEREESAATFLLPRQTGSGGDELEIAGSTSSSATDSATLVVLLSTFVAVCGSLLYGSALGYSSPAESGIIDDIGLSTAAYSVFGSTLTIGGMFGAITSGKIADIVGRRGTMGISAIFCFMGWLSIAFAEGIWLLDLGRLLIGCGIGVYSYVVPIYVAEIAPKNMRGGLTTLVQVMISFGVSLMYLIGTAVDWRILALIGTIPCIIQFLGLFFIPESPRWLEKIGQTKKCEASLRRLRGANADISEEAADIRDYTKIIEQFADDNFLELFKWEYAFSLLVGIGLMILQQFGGIGGITFYASEIFESTGFSNTVGSITLAIIQPCMAIVGALLMDKAGRRSLLMVSTAGTCLGCVIAGLSFVLQDFKEGSAIAPALVYVGLVVYFVFYPIGGAIPWVIMSEIFPINVKGSAGSLVAMVNWLFSWIVTYTFNFLFEWSSVGTFFIFASVCVLNIVFVAKLVSETKGRTLEEIQASMNKFSTKR